MSTKDVRENTVWEEAGAEFYQENYKGQRSNSTATRIPLPSHTARRNSGWKAGTGAYTHRRGTTLGTGVDYNIIDGIPDLADESLGNEKSTLYQLESFKSMPITMTEKRGLKGQLQANPTLKLMGWKGIHWRLERTLRTIAELKKYFSMTLFAKQMWSIESRFGFVFAWYFQEIKALLVMNLITGIIFGFYFLYPFMLQVVTSSLVHNSTEISSFGEFGEDSNGTGLMTTSTVFQWKNLTQIISDHHSFIYYGFNFSTPCMVISMIGVYFGLSIFYCFFHTWKCLKEKIELKHIERACCDLIFAGWHHFTKCKVGAEFKRATIQKEIKAFLFAINVGEQNQCGLFGIRACVNIIAITLITICAVLVWHLQEFSQNFHLQFNGHLELIQVGIYFLPQIFICCSWMMLSLISERMGKWEKYKYENRVLVLALRCWLIRLILLAVFIIRFFSIRYSHRNPINADPEKHGTWVFQEPCWESDFAKEIYKFFLVDITLKIVVTFTLEPLRVLMGKLCPIGSVHFHCVSNAMDVLSIQGLSWLGIYFAPFMPFAVSLHMVLLFLVKSFSLMANCRGSPDIYRPIHNLLIPIKIATLVLCTCVVITIFGCVQPSDNCGPFRDFETPWEYIRTSMPSNVTETFVGYSLNQVGMKYPHWSLPILLILACICIYYKCVIRNGETMIETLRHLLVLEGHDKQFLFRRVEAMQGTPT